MRKPVTATWTFAALLASTPALAHIEYYDLNQGAHISDLTATGRTASTAQYGQTPADVLALNGPPRADGIATVGISAHPNMPLNNTALWNATNQVYIGGGTFSGLTYTPTASTATVDVNDVTDWAWADGTKTTLGDSHRVDFFNFRLSQTSNVVITWNVNTGNTYLDCAFSLYTGVLPYQGHDDAAEILNPFKVGTGKVQDVLDTGNYRDAQGILSVFRNTGPGAPTYLGQFNALNNWSQASPAGYWGAIAYITSVNARIMQLSTNPADTLETLSIQLPPGNYTIAASGALGAAGSGASFGLTNLHGRLTYSATAATTDTDGDGIADAADNCIQVANPTQADADNDGFGNHCDGDLNNSGGTVNFADLSVFRTAFGTSNANADLNASGGTVNFADLSLFRALFGNPAGPSGHACAGTVPCPPP
jgi:hypothetical protein